MSRKVPSLEMLIVTSTLNEGLLSLRVFDRADGRLHTPKKYLEIAGFKDGDKAILRLVPKKKKSKSSKRK
jgi:hypothetical protein